MAKPNHTAYQVQADFPDSADVNVTLNSDDVYVGPMALANDCVDRSTIQSARFGRKPGHALQFAPLEKGNITFGYDNANKLLESARQQAKSQFRKGERPTFFLRKLTMSEFMSHVNFKNYENNTTIKTLYKKYLLMDLLK